MSVDCLVEDKRWVDIEALALLATEATFARLGLEPSVFEISLLACNDARIAALNEDFRGKPVVGLLNTWSDLNTCHSHFRERAEEIKRGVFQKGGFPVEIPVMSLGEMMMKPTTMLYRNLLAMEAEEVNEFF